MYCSDSPLKLQNVQASNTFIYLEKALQAHLVRYPTIKNGLNNIENRILETAAKDNITTEIELINDLLKNQGIYGFGDIQFKNIAFTYGTRKEVFQDLSLSISKTNSW